MRSVTFSQMSACSGVETHSLCGSSGRGAPGGAGPPQSMQSTTTRAPLGTVSRGATEASM